MKDKQSFKELRSKTIAHYCRELRIKHLKQSQAEIGKAVGVTQQVICDFEAGKNDNYLILAYYINNELLFFYPEVFEHEKIYYKRAT